MSASYGSVPVRMGSLLPPVIIEGITTPAKPQHNATSSSSSSSSSSTSTEGKLSIGATSLQSGSTFPMYPGAASFPVAQNTGGQTWIPPPVTSAVGVTDRQQAGPVSAMRTETSIGLSYVMPRQQAAIPQSTTKVMPVSTSTQVQQVSGFVPTSQTQASTTIPTSTLSAHTPAGAPTSAMFTQQQLQLAQLQLAGAHAVVQPNGVLHINTQLPPHILAQLGAGSVHGMLQPQVPHANQAVVKPTQSTLPLASSDGHPSQRAAQLARYRQKRNARLQALAMGDKKIRYQCRKTLADARPRVKGRFAKVHTDGLESPSSGASSPKCSKAKAAKSKVMKTVMSAVDLTSAQGMDHTIPKMEDLNELNPMWWLNDSDDTDGKNSSSVSAMGDFCDDGRRCYSENNLLQLDAFDVNAAMEVFQTENNFNAICSALNGSQVS